MLLLLFKVLPSLLLRILGLGRNPYKTLGLETTNNHPSMEIHTNQRSILKFSSSIPLILASLLLLSSSSSSSLFSSSPFLLHVFGLPK